MTEKFNRSGTPRTDPRRRYRRGGNTARCGRRRRAPRLRSPPVNDKDYPDFTLIKINGGDDSLAKIQKKGARRRAPRTTGRIRFLTTKTNEWTGLDGDILKYVAKMLKIDKVKVQTVTFDGMIPGLLDGRFDIIGELDPLHEEPLKSGELLLGHLLLCGSVGGAEG